MIDQSTLLRLATEAGFEPECLDDFPHIKAEWFANVERFAALVEQELAKKAGPVPRETGQIKENSVHSSSSSDNALPELNGWRDISTAPKDGTEILAYREDAGIFVIRWSAPIYFMSEREIEAACKEIGDTDWLEQEDWFCADFMAGDRLEGSLVPTRWMPFPPPPLSTDKGEA